MSSHPPSALVGVPIISPFSARQVAWPTGRMAPIAEPENVQSGTNVAGTTAEEAAGGLPAGAADCPYGDALTAIANAAVKITRLGRRNMGVPVALNSRAC